MGKLSSTDSAVKFSGIIPEIRVIFSTVLFTLRCILKQIAVEHSVFQNFPILRLLEYLPKEDGKRTSRKGNVEITISVKYR